MPFDPNIHPPRTTNCLTTCSSRLCHFSASQLEWSFLLYCLLLRPWAWLPGCRPTRLDDLDSVTATREMNQARDVNVIFCFRSEVNISKGKEMVRGLHHSGLTVITMFSFCRAVIECTQHCPVPWKQAGFPIRTKKLYRQSIYKNSMGYTLFFSNFRKLSFGYEHWYNHS